MSINKHEADLAEHRGLQHQLCRVEHQREMAQNDGRITRARRKLDEEREIKQRIKQLERVI